MHCSYTIKLKSMFHIIVIPYIIYILYLSITNYIILLLYTLYIHLYEKYNNFNTNYYIFFLFEHVLVKQLCIFQICVLNYGLML